MWILKVAVSIGLVAGAIYGLHRFLLVLESRGYIYYKEKSRGSGLAGAMFEADKLVRPSSENVVQAQEVHVESQENDGD